MEDYFAALPLIVARLEEQIPGVDISPIWGMARVLEQPESLPTIKVILELDKPMGGAEYGIQKIEQVWLCVVMMKETAEESGTLVAQVLRALSGHRLGKSFSPFKRVASTFIPDTSPQQVSYFPAAFSTSFVFNI